MRDVLLLLVYAAGCAVVAVGLGMAWLPLGVIAAGVTLVAGAQRLGRES